MKLSPREKEKFSKSAVDAKHYGSNSNTDIATEQAETKAKNERRSKANVDPPVLQMDRAPQAQRNWN